MCGKMRTVIPIQKVWENETNIPTQKVWEMRTDILIQKVWENEIRYSYPEAVGK